MERGQAEAPNELDCSGTRSQGHALGRLQGLFALGGMVSKCCRASICQLTGV